MELTNLEHIENKIFTIKNMHVMLDSDLAELYQVSTGRLNEQVKRNKDRFPHDFMFQLCEHEWEEVLSQNTGPNNSPLRSQNAILKERRGKHRKYLPYVFTEQGVAGLSGILKSERAVKVHIEIMRAFVTMRKFLLQNASVFQRIDQLELKQLQSDEKFNQIFKALEAGQPKPDKGIFFDGQVFDAYAFVADLYHIGASLKDLGKKWFAFSRMDSMTALLLTQLKNVK